MTVLNQTLTPDDFFLSATNPVATSDQRDLEALALRAFASPQVQKAKDAAKFRWRKLIGDLAPQEAFAKFDLYLGEEWAFQKVIKAVNSDPNHPKVMGNLWAAAHSWFGMDVPGGRASDNPDNSYCFVPINGYSRYELWGRRLNPDIDAPIQLVANPPMTTTLGLLDWDDLTFEPDGSFIVTLDPDPADGRRNHIQTTIDARYLLMRDSRSDWRQAPNAYRIRKLDPPAAKPMTFDEICNRAAILIVEDVFSNFWWFRTKSQAVSNSVPPAFNTSEIGGISTQRVLHTRLRLEKDEAFVLTIRNHGARYRGLLLSHPLSRTLDYWAQTTCFNNGQCDSNPDDTTTFVISAVDPGIWNWVDTAGLREPILNHRWQGIPAAADGETDWAAGGLVKLRDLDRTLPATMRSASSDERRRQLQARQDEWALRFLDH